MSSQGLEIDRQGHSLIAVVGDVDANTVAALAVSVADLDAHGRIDLSECTFMDSSGLAWLVEAKNAAESRNGSITLVAPSPPVVQILRMSGLADVFDIEPASH